MHMSVNRIVCSVLGRVIVVGVNDRLLSNLYLSDTELISRRLISYCSNSSRYASISTESPMAHASGDHV